MFSNANDNQNRHRPVAYDSRSHVAVLFQTYGSVWKRVLPFCIANVLLTGLILWLDKSYDINLTFEDSGHTFMSVIVAFLIISRVNMTLSTYTEASKQLAQIYLSSRELMQYVATKTQRDKTDSARAWRNEVAYRCCVLLRVTCAMLEHRSSHRDSWDVPELDEEERQSGRLSAMGENRMFEHQPEANYWAQGYKTVDDENLRYPLRMASRLRSVLMTHGECLEQPFGANHEIKLWGFTEDFMSGYQGLRRLINTPFPFPLAQMASTFLFFYVFTLPFALLTDISKVAQSLIMIFIITYGFVGLEYVAIELDDPFGDDPSDFDHLAGAYMVFEDIFMTIFDVDGIEYADKLRARMKNKHVVSPAFEAAEVASGNFSAIDALSTALLDKAELGKTT